MEFYENRARRPFIGFVLLWRWMKKVWLRHQTARILSRLSDHQLRDIGLRRSDIGD